MKRILMKRILLRHLKKFGLAKILSYLIVFLSFYSSSCSLSYDDPKNFSMYGFEVDLPVSETKTKKSVVRFPYSEINDSDTYPIRIKIENCPSSIDNCTASHVAEAKKAISVWNSYSIFGEYLLQEVTKNPQIIIFWINDFEDDEALTSLADGDADKQEPGYSDNIIGQCQASFLYSNVLDQLYFDLPEVILMATHYGATGDLTEIPLKYINLVAAHELGHCLGLWQHSKEENDLMNAVLSEDTKLSIRDVNTLRYLYSSSADAVPSDICEGPSEVTGKYADDAACSSRPMDIREKGVYARPLVHPVSIGF